MRLAVFLLPAALIFTGCVPAEPLRSNSPEPSATPPTIKQPVAETTPSVPVPPPQATSPSSPPKVTRREISGITFEGVSFHSGSHRLRVIDQPNGPGSRFADAQSAAASIGGIAAANAGFFTPEGAPLGKLISSGKPAGNWNSSSLGAGVYLESSSAASIVRRQAASSGSARELLQAGPLLVENGRGVSGLENSKPAARVFLLWDGGQRWWLGRSSPCTLAQLGAALNSASPASWPIKQALNLDGGRSSDLWISGAVFGGPTSFRSLFNRPVRNFLVLVPR